MNNIIKSLYKKHFSKQTTTSIFELILDIQQNQYPEFFDSLNLKQRLQFSDIIQNLALLSDENKANLFNAGFDCGVTYLRNLLCDGTITLKDIDTEKVKRTITSTE